MSSYSQKVIPWINISTAPGERGMNTQVKSQPSGSVLPLKIYYCGIDAAWR